MSGVNWMHVTCPPGKRMSVKEKLSLHDDWMNPLLVTVRFMHCQQGWVVKTQLFLLVQRAPLTTLGTSHSPVACFGVFTKCCLLFYS